MSFALERGEVVTVVGGNGSVKSTLLLTIAGVLRPDAGALTTFGHSATLLTLGSWLPGGPDWPRGHTLERGLPRLSPREDRDLARADHRVLRARAVHVSTYSTGIRARLGFSIAPHLEPQILLLDEVLGVGDASFEERSREKLDELMSRAQAVVVVSHHPAFVRDIATNGLWLERGGLSALGDLEASTEEYIAEVRKAHEPMKAAA